MRGGSSWAFFSEIPSELIQLYGDWNSDVYKNYLRFNFEDKLDISRPMGEHINKKKSNLNFVESSKEKEGQ